MNHGPTSNESAATLSEYKLYPLFAKAEYKGKVIDLLNEEWPRSITQRKISIAKCTNPDPPMSFILIEQSTEELIGHGKVCPVPNDSTSCWVESVIVVKTKRGKGVGRLLMNFLEEEARKRNYTKMCLSTEEKEVFYRKCGYVDSPPILNFGANSKLFEKFPMKNLEPVLNANESGNKNENSSNTSHSSAATTSSPPPPPPPCLMNKTNPLFDELRMVTSIQNVPNIRSGRSDRAETESGMSASTEITRMSVDPLISSENLFGERQRKTTSISPEQALIHLIKVMMGTGMLSLPLAFRYSGLWLGMFLLVIICVICTYCCRVLVHASQYLCTRKGQEAMDYANVMRNAVELGPPWIRRRGYFAKQLVNSSMFIAQLGFCCIYFVFMADNLKQFFDETSNIKISQAGWIALLLVPTMALCTIRQLKVLAPLALIANVVYVAAVGIIIAYLVTNLNPVNSVPAVGDYRDLPLFFGTVIFAFEGIAVVLPIENQMNEPQHFISSNGVLNTACILVLAVYCTTGFYGYLAFGNQVKDTITLNMPPTAFFQVIKIMLVGCILISYPLQFYVPMERIEKWISRKIAPEKQNLLVYSLRYTLVVVTCLGAELIPHLALFISLIGAFAGSALALLFPPIIDLLCAYSQRKLTQRKWALNLFLFIFGIFGFITGTYASLVQIMEAFGKSDV